MRKLYKSRGVYSAALVVFLLILCSFSIGALTRPRGVPLGYKVVSRGTIVASAYNSLPGQTDSSPWITASGTLCHEGVIASNHFPIGTKLLIEGYKGQVFVVEDRMNKRYGKKIDIWFRDYDEAIHFGVRKVKYSVIKSA
jgi:3D (Asp-Asp-Asp) domain-containing protein